MKTLIKNAEIVTMNPTRQIWEVGDILVEDDKIAWVGPRPADFQFETVERVIEAAGRTAIPGFVQTHIHLCQTLFRGRANDMALLDWLYQRIWPLEAAHDPESIYYSALLGLGEMIASGTTAIVDMETVHHTDAAFEAIEQSGMRAISGKVMMDFGADRPLGLSETTAASLQASYDLLEKWHGRDNGRIEYAFCPRVVFTCTAALLREVVTVSEQRNIKVHTHASENQAEIELVQQLYGMRNVAYLDYLGLASPRLILAHCIWLDENEREIIAQRGVKVSHCPGSNLKLASGIAPIPDLLRRGVTVGLGADGAACNNNLNMWQEIRLAALLQRPEHGPTAMPAESVLEMATLGGARAMGLEDRIGSLEVGKQADIVLLDLHNLHNFPDFDLNPVYRLVYSAQASDVETVLINGRIVLENRQLKTIDAPTVMRESNKAIKRLLARI